MKLLGGIAIDRRPRTAGWNRKSFVEAMINFFRDKQELIIVITPGGTHSLRDKWQTACTMWPESRGTHLPPLCR